MRKSVRSNKSKYIKNTIEYADGKHICIFFDILYADTRWCWTNIESIAFWSEYGYFYWWTGLWQSFGREAAVFTALYHKTEKGQRVSFQTWEWQGDNYKLTQYIIDDEGTLQTGKFECEYRATRREEMTKLLYSSGCSEVAWKFPEETGFYQPIVVAKK